VFALQLSKSQSVSNAAYNFPGVIQLLVSRTERHNRLRAYWLDCFFGFVSVPTTLNIAFIWAAR